MERDAAGHGDGGEVTRAAQAARTVAAAFLPPREVEDVLDVVPLADDDVVGSLRALRRLVHARVQVSEEVEVLVLDQDVGADVATIAAILDLDHDAVAAHLSRVRAALGGPDGAAVDVQPTGPGDAPGDGDPAGTGGSAGTGADERWDDGDDAGHGPGHDRPTATAALVEGSDAAVAATAAALLADADVSMERRERVPSAADDAAGPRALFASASDGAVPGDWGPGDDEPVPHGAGTEGAGPDGADPTHAVPRGAEPAGGHAGGVPEGGADPAPAEPAAADPASADTASVGIAPADPAAADPAGADPAGADPAGADPARIDPAGSDPASADVAPTPPRRAGRERLASGIARRPWVPVAALLVAAVIAALVLRPDDTVPRAGEPAVGCPDGAPVCVSDVVVTDRVTAEGEPAASLDVLDADGEVYVWWRNELAERAEEARLDIAWLRAGSNEVLLVERVPVNPTPFQFVAFRLRPGPGDYRVEVRVADAGLAPLVSEDFTLG